MRCITTEIGHRRRGDELVAAIEVAVLEEMAARGFAGLTVEGVAERAGVGKASIYRRWPGKLELALDALDRALPDFADLPDTGSVRSDLIAALRILANAMNGPCGMVMRGSAVDAEELLAAVEKRVVAPRRGVFIGILRRAIARGEVRTDAARPRIAEVGPMLLHAELIRDGHISDRSVVAVVDEVLIPMLRP